MTTTFAAPAAMTIFSDNTAWITVDAQVPTTMCSRIMFSGLASVKDNDFSAKAHSGDGIELTNLTVVHTPTAAALRHAVVTTKSGATHAGTVSNYAGGTRIAKIDDSAPAGTWHHTGDVVFIDAKSIEAIAMRPALPADGVHINTSGDAAGESVELRLAPEMAGWAARATLEYTTNALSWTARSTANVSDDGAHASLEMNALVENNGTTIVRLAKRVKLSDAAFASTTRQQSQSAIHYARSVQNRAASGFGFAQPADAFGGAVCTLGGEGDGVGGLAHVAAQGAPSDAAPASNEWTVNDLDAIQLAPKSSLLLHVAAPGTAVVARNANVLVIDVARLNMREAASVSKSLVFENVGAVVPRCTLAVRESDGTPLGVAALPRLCVGDGARVEYGASQSFSVARTVDEPSTTTRNGERVQTQRVHLNVVWRPRTTAERAAVEVWVPIDDTPYVALSYDGVALESIHRSGPEPRQGGARTDAARRLHVFTLAFTRAAPSADLEFSVVQKSGVALGASRQ